MVSSLQLSSKSPPLDAMLAKSESGDFETTQPLSFGEILKIKEKQLQQEQGVNASSVAAVLAALQTLPISMPDSIQGADSLHESDKPDMQPALQLESSPPNPAQPLSESLTPRLTTEETQEKTVAETKLMDLQASTPTPIAEISESVAIAVGKNEIPASISPTTGQTLHIESSLSVSAVLPNNRIDEATSQATIQEEILDVEHAQSVSTQASEFVGKTTIGDDKAAFLPDRDSSYKPAKDAILLEAKEKVDQAPILLPYGIEISSDQIAIKPGTSIIRTKVIEPQVSTTNPAIEDLELSNVGMVVNDIDVENRTENILAEPELQSSLHARISPHFMPYTLQASQTRVNEEIVEAPEIAVTDTNITSQVAEDPQQTTDISNPIKISAATDSDSMIENNASQLKLSAEKRSTTADDRVESQLTEAKTYHEKLMVESKSIEEQVSIDTSTNKVSQDTTQPIGNVEAVSLTDNDLKTSNQSGNSVDPKPISMDVQTAPVIKSETIINETHLSGQLTPNQSTPVSLKSDDSIKVKPGEENLKVKEPTSKDEKKLVLDKKQELNNLSETTGATTYPSKEAAMVGITRKESLTQNSMQATEVIQQIIQEMKVSLKSSPTTMHLQLNQKELGAIDIQMVTNSQGVNVSFFAEQSSTTRLLETQINQLRQALVDSGIQLSGLNINQHGQPGREGGFLNQNTNFARYSQYSAPQSKANIKETTQPGRIGQTSEVDYLI